MTLAIDLPDEEIKALAAKAQAQGLSAWEVIAENMKNVPPEDFAALPKDGLRQIDHYVYGVPN
jgi:hypothetical protein